jgi:hypothetical protein
MKKYYKLTVHYDDDMEEVESLPEVLEDGEAEDIWLDTGEITILLPAEMAKYLEETGILGMA